MIDRESIMSTLDAEISNLEDEISGLRTIRETTTHRLEQAVRERDRLSRYIASATREEGLA